MYLSSRRQSISAIQSQLELPQQASRINSSNSNNTYRRRHSCLENDLNCRQLSCLATQTNRSSNNKGIPLEMCDLITKLSSRITNSESTESELPKEFGKQHLLNLLKQVNKSLISTLSQYRINFPSTEPEKILDLKSSVQLLIKICTLRRKIKYNSDNNGDDDNGDDDDCNPAVIMRNCAEISAKSTYKSIFKSISNSNLNCSEMWQKIIDSIANAINEDQQFYSSSINQFQLNFDITYSTANTMWNCIANDLPKHLQLALKDDNSEIIAEDFITLMFRIKWLNNKYLNIAQTGNYMHYPKWFEPFLKMWLQQTEISAMQYAVSAFNRDKNESFGNSSANTAFSSSVIDIFAQLSECLQVIQQMECANKEVLDNVINHFAIIVEKSLQSYLSCIKSEMMNLLHQQQQQLQQQQQQNTACILLNNIHQLRIELHKIYESIQQLQQLQDSTEIRMQNLQSELSDCLQQFVNDFSKFHYCHIATAVLHVAKLLQHKVKSSTATTTASTSDENTVASSSSSSSSTTHVTQIVLQPLIEVLDAKLASLAVKCDATVFKRILKCLWHYTMICFRKKLLLPNIHHHDSDSDDDVDVASRELHSLDAFVKDTLHHKEWSKQFTMHQISLLQKMLQQVETFFHANSNGLKVAFMHKSSQYILLNHAISLYSFSTDALITQFVQIAKQAVGSSQSPPVGEISYEAQCHLHAGTGEATVTVHVISAHNVQSASSSLLRSFVQLHMGGPHLRGRKRIMNTKSKAGTNHPKFNESFTFHIGKVDNFNNYILQFNCKDYCFAREDRILGLCQLQLSDIAAAGDAGVCSSCCLHKKLELSEDAKVILKILSFRKNDAIAVEFVKMKYLCKTD